MGLLGGDWLEEKETEACGSIVTLVEGCERAWAEQEVINGGGAASPSPIWKAGRAKGEGEQDDTMSHNNQLQYAWCAIQYQWEVDTQREWKHVDKEKKRYIKNKTETLC